MDYVGDDALWINVIFVFVKLVPLRITMAERQDAEIAGFVKEHQISMEWRLVMTIITQLHARENQVHTMK